MKIKNAMLFSLILIISVSLFSGCSNKEKKNDSKVNVIPNVNSDGTVSYKSPIDFSVKDKHIKPDTDKIKIGEGTKKIYYSKNEKEFAKAMENFACPQGNEYDAYCILGSFRYSEGEKETLERFKEASKVWHDEIVKKVGEKCIVKIKLNESADIDLTDEKVKEWSDTSAVKCEGYKNIKIDISTNYAEGSKQLSLDIVNVKGNWYLANIGTLNKIRDIITTEIYK